MKTTLIVVGILLLLGAVLNHQSQSPISAAVAPVSASAPRDYFDFQQRCGIALSNKPERMVHGVVYGGVRLTGESPAGSQVLIYHVHVPWPAETDGYLSVLFTGRHPYPNISQFDNVTFLYNAQVWSEKTAMLMLDCVGD
jgi:hypothetical protein